MNRVHILFITGLTILLVIFGCSRSSINLIIQAKTSNKHLPKMNNIEYIALEQDGIVEGSYKDKVIYAEKNEDIINRIIGCIIKGKIIDSFDTNYNVSKSLIISIKLKDGTYMEGDYNNGYIIFNKPSRIVIQPEQYFENAINEIIEGKI